MADFDRDNMNIYAHVAESSYKRGNRSKQNEMSRNYGDRFDLIEEDTDTIHSVFRDTETGKILIGIRGTDVKDAQGGKVKDLLTDAAVTFGLTKLTSRFKKSDKKIGNLVKKYGKDNIILASHSLGGSVSKELVFNHDVESHAFNPGGTSLSFRQKFRGFGKDINKKVKKNHTYYVAPSAEGTGADLLSFGTVMDIFHTPHFVQPKKLTKSQRGVLFHHSLRHFTKD